MIITSGAVSAGKFDYVPVVIKKFKLSNYFKNVAIRPGKPILFARIKGKKKQFLVFLVILFHQLLVLDFLFTLILKEFLGLTPEKPLMAILKNSFEKKKISQDSLKARISTTQNGIIEVELLKGQESFR